MDDAYAAGADAEAWSGWSRSVMERLDGTCVNFAVLDRSNGATLVQTLHHPDAGAVERYFAEGHHHRDPQLRYVATLGRDSVYTDLNYLDREAPENVGHHLFCRSVARIEHHASMLVHFGGGRFLGGVSIHNHVDHGPVTRTTTDALAHLLPDVRRAMQLAYEHGDKLTDAYWSGVGMRAEAALLLARDGGILRMTDEAERLLRGGGGLVAARNRLTGKGTPAAPLAQALQRALAPHGSRGETIRIPRACGRAPLVVTVFPLTPRTGLVPSLDPAALVTITDPARPRTAAVGLLQDAFDLSGREAEVAGLLLANHSVESAAATLGISIPTCRVHLRRLFAKTGTSRQTELLLLLDRINTPGG